MNENLDPKGQEEKDKKKASSAAPWMPASAGAAKRGKWGTMFSKSGPVGRLVATKAGAIALAVGVMAVAAVAGVVLSKIQPSAPEKGGSQFAARAASKYYNPSGARKGNQSSLSLITGNRDYRDEAASAVMDPESAVEEMVQPTEPELPSVVPHKGKFSPSAASPSTGGGGSASVMSSNGNKAKKEEAKNSGLSDAFNSAKAGAGMRSTGLGGRSPIRAAGGKSRKRQASSASRGQSYVAPSGIDSIGKLEAMKAAADAKFKEGNSPVGLTTGAGAAAPDLASSSAAEMPEAPSDSSSASSAGGGGGGGGGGEAECEDAATDLKRASEILMKSTREFAELAAGSGGDNPYDGLCNVDGKGSTGKAITDMVGAMNLMNESLKKLAEGSCVTNPELDGWECGVLCRAQKEALPAVETAETMCQNYYTRRQIDIQREGKAAENMRHVMEDEDYSSGGIHRVVELSMNKYDQIKAAEETALEAGKDSAEFEALKDFNTALNGDGAEENNVQDNGTVDQRLSDMMKTAESDCVYETQDIDFSLKDQRGTKAEIEAHNRATCEQVARYNCDSTFALLNNTLDNFNCSGDKRDIWNDDVLKEQTIQAAIESCMANHGRDTATLNENIESIVLQTKGSDSSSTDTSTESRPTTGLHEDVDGDGGLGGR